MSLASADPPTSVGERERLREVVDREHRLTGHASTRPAPSRYLGASSNLRAVTVGAPRLTRTHRLCSHALVTRQVFDSNLPEVDYRPDLKHSGSSTVAAGLRRSEWSPLFVGFVLMVSSGVHVLIPGRVDIVDWIADATPPEASPVGVAAHDRGRGLRTSRSSVYDALRDAGPVLVSGRCS